MGQGHPEWVGIVMRYPDGTVQAWQLASLERCAIRAEQKLSRATGYQAGPTAVEFLIQGYATDWPADPALAGGAGT